MAKKRRLSAKQLLFFAKRPKTRTIYKTNVRRVGTMARKRGRRTFRRGSRRSFAGVGGIMGLVRNAGMGYAVGTGVESVLISVARMINVKPIADFAPMAGALSAYQAGGGGISGIAAALPQATKAGLTLGSVFGGAGASSAGSADWHNN